MRKADCPPLAGPRRRAARKDLFDAVAAPEPGEERNSRRELQRRVMVYGLAHCLTPGQRQAVELCYGRGLTVTQAARELGLAPSSVSRRLSGALRRLRALAREPGAG